jgi:hypothetical protein
MRSFVLACFVVLAIAAWGALGLGLAVLISRVSGWPFGFMAGIAYLAISVFVLAEIEEQGW